MRRALILALGLLAAVSCTAAEPAISSQPLFAATLSDMNDKPVALERFKGKPLIVNFWARWCAPCREEIPELREFRQHHQGKIEVIGIGLEDEAAPVREFAKKLGMNYPVFLGKEQAIPLMQALGNRKGGLPYTLAIDASGQVVSSKMGLLKKADLDGFAKLLLKQ
jgi:thiol-disulfide isomerase/thioredoxin